MAEKERIVPLVERPQQSRHTFYTKDMAGVPFRESFSNKEVKRLEFVRLMLQQEIQKQ